MLQKQPRTRATAHFKTAGKLPQRVYHPLLDAPARVFTPPTPAVFRKHPRSITRASLQSAPPVRASSVRHPLGGSHMLKNAYFLRQVENRGHAFLAVVISTSKASSRLGVRPPRAALQVLPQQDAESPHGRPTHVAGVHRHNGPAPLKMSKAFDYDAYLSQFRSADGSSAELAARLLRLTGVGAQVSKAGDGGVWRVIATTYKLAAGRKELGDALAEFADAIEKWPRGPATPMRTEVSKLPRERWLFNLRRP